MRLGKFHKLIYMLAIFFYIYEELTVSWHSIVQETSDTIKDRNMFSQWLWPMLLGPWQTKTIENTNRTQVFLSWTDFFIMAAIVSKYTFNKNNWLVL